MNCKHAGQKKVGEIDCEGRHVGVSSLAVRCAAAWLGSGPWCSPPRTRRCSATPDTERTAGLLRGRGPAHTVSCSTAGGSRPTLVTFVKKKREKFKKIKKFCKKIKIQGFENIQLAHPSLPEGERFKELPIQNFSEINANKNPLQIASKRRKTLTLSNWCL